jgi:CDP-glucose 4,6-dehydratase
VAGYVEDDALGGHDPYSASKAMADLLTQSWVASFPGCPTAIARAGNVIGGGDVCKDRLLPDLLRAFAEGRPAQIRYPAAVRPWQHVLDCLNGYVLLSDALVAGDGIGAWNFGPGPESFVTVGEIADLAAGLWGDGAAWTTDGDDHPHEAELLALDASRARAELGWNDRLAFAEAVTWTVQWEAARVAGGRPLDLTLEQIRAFMSGPDRP